MAGLSRADLKSLVREILVEVLEEGIGRATLAERAERPELLQHRAPAKRQFDPRLDTRVRRAPDPIREAVRREAGNNPLMQSILSDTASRTLPTLSANDRQIGRNDAAAAAGSSPGIQQVEQINGTPEEVFGEDTAGRWADLAFAAPKKLG